MRSIATRAAGLVAVVLLAAACGSSSSSSKPSSSATTSPTTTTTTSPTTTTTTPTTTTSPASPSETATAGGAPADQAAAKAQITANWEKFFDPKTAVADKAKYLENGDKLAPLLQGFASDPRVGQVSAKVSNVVFTSPTTATVTYALSLSGTVVEPNATGKAVLQDGTWKVSLSSLCGLLALTGSTSLPGCS